MITYMRRPAVRRLLVATLSASFALAAVGRDFAGGTLGTPSDGSIVSGVGVISGFYCLPEPIEVLIDGKSIGAAGGGTSLAAPKDYCGGRTNTGYSVLYNFNNLSVATHTVTVRTPSMQLTSNRIFTAQSAGAAWRTGLQRTHTLPDFPEPGMRATLTWSESSQSFVITKVDAAPDDEVCIATMQRVDALGRCAMLPGNTSTIPRLTGALRCADDTCWGIAKDSGKVAYLLTSMREDGKNSRPVVFATYGFTSADTGQARFQVMIAYADAGDLSPYPVHYDSSVLDRVQSVRVVSDGLEIRRSTYQSVAAPPKYQCSVLRWEGSWAENWKEYDAGPC